MIATTEANPETRVRQIECHTSRVERRIEVTSHAEVAATKGLPQVATVESCITTENPQTAFPVQPMLQGHASAWSREEWKAFKTYADQAWEEYDRRFGRRAHE